jgi:hypothetical protein
MENSNVATMTEVMMRLGENDYYARFKEQARILLDFVERYNKQDAEPDVARAAQFIASIVNK